MSDPSKPLDVASFSGHATRGLIRARTSRRAILTASIVVAVVMLLAGVTVLAPWLDIHKRPFYSLGYWSLCAWVTAIALLLAFYDLLSIRREANELAARLRAEAGKSRGEL